MTSSKRLIQGGILAVAIAALITLVMVQVNGADTAPAADSDGGQSPRIVQPGAPGEPGRELSEEEYANITPPAYSQADVEFFQGMIHHHAQALDMTALVQDHAEGSDLPLLAERIAVTQRDEIALMERWLTERGLEVPGDHAAHGGAELMPGMLTDEEFAQLEQASGNEFNRLFLEFMIKHHEGALVMVEELFAGDGGLEPQSNQLAIDIEADQRIEIRRMQELLATLESAA